MSQNGYQDFFKKVNSVKDHSDLSKKAMPKSKLKQNSKKIKKNKSTPILLSLFGVGACMLGLLAIDESFNFPKISFNMFPVSFASSQEKEGNHKTEVDSVHGGSEVKSTTHDNSNKAPGELADAASGSAEQDGHNSGRTLSVDHLSSLVKRSKELDAREQELARVESDLANRSEELNKKIAKLEQMQKAISERLKEQIQVDEVKVNQLVEVYSSMRAEKAAKIFEEIDEDLAVAVIGKMKKKNAAEILNLMDTAKAKKFAEMYSGFRRSADLEQK